MSTQDIAVTHPRSPPEAVAGVRDYAELLKPRVMSLVVFTGLAGLLIAPGQVHPLIALTAILCIAVASGAAGAINMWYDRDIDAVMKRTQSRPIPSGRVSPESALEFGVILTVGAILVMGVAVNWLSGLLLASASAFYIFIYTIWLKRRTPQNIVIGGAAGAFPPVIGWTAATGSADVLPLILFALIFLWTPPHFWALALFSNEDYKRAKIPMLPVVSGGRITKIQMLVYTLLLLPLSLSPWALDFSSLFYALGAGLLSLVFIYYAIRVYLSKTDTAAKKMFGFSIIYLFGVFALLVIDRLLLKV